MGTVVGGDAVATDTGGANSPDVAATDTGGANSPDVAATDTPGGNSPDVAATDTPGGNSPDVAATDTPGGNSSDVAATDLATDRGTSDSGTTGEPDPFAGVTVRPDVDTTPVADCAGQPDMSLCNVVTTPDRWYDICVGGKCVSPGCGDTSCNVPAPHFQIPANSNHQHLQVQPGPQPIVIDLVTGLHWQGCDAGRSGETCATGTSQEMTWPDALAYCDGLTWGGKNDWYLPDHYELESIDDWAKISDQYSLDPIAFPHPSNWYWSTHFGSQARVYGIQYRGSAMVVIYDSITSVGFEVRCARRGFSRNASYTAQRFTRVGTTISDAATGLVWQACASGRSGTTTCAFDGVNPTAYAATEAVAYCDALVAGGFSDWRLPTYKELHSVLEFPPKSGGVDPKIVAIDGHRPYLLCRAGWQPDARVLLASVADGNPITPSATSTYPIICVRGH